MRQYIGKLVKSSSIGKKIYWYYRLKRDSKKVFENFKITDNLEFEFQKIKEANKKYGWLPDEYYLYHYNELTDSKRKSFICEQEHVEIADFLNTANARKILGNKWKTYLEYSPFFCRGACCITNTADNVEKWNDLFRLFDRCGKLIVKPLDGSFGKGIQIMENVSNKRLLQTRLITDYPKGFIAEEIIKQDIRMAVLHEESVNTLRIHTICFDGSVTVFHPYLRIGRGNSVVDNAGSGGIFTSCNPENGEILSVVDEFGRTFSKHPDTNFQLIGYKVPCWNEAFDIAQKLALHNSDVHYAGWDLALTEHGLVLIEGNPRAQFIFQISEQKGFRDELQTILNKYGKLYKSTYFTEKTLCDI